MLLGACIAGMLIAAIGAWTPAFLTRTHGMPTRQVGLWLGVIAGVPGAAGMFLGGYLADRLGRSDARWRLWIVAVGFAISTPFVVLAYLTPDARLSLLSLSIPYGLCSFFFQATTFATGQALAGIRMRAMASAVVLFCINLFAAGLGPLIAGRLSDMLTPMFGAASLRVSLAVMSVLALWGAAHYVLAGFYLPADLIRTRIYNTQAPSSGGAVPVVPPMQP
jgi:MFS family permease